MAIILHHKQSIYCSAFHFIIIVGYPNENKRLFEIKIAKITNILWFEDYQLAAKYHGFPVHSKSCVIANKVQLSEDPKTCDTHLVSPIFSFNVIFGSFSINRLVFGCPAQHREDPSPLCAAHRNSAKPFPWLNFYLIQQLKIFFLYRKDESIDLYNYMLLF